MNISSSENTATRTKSPASRIPAIVFALSVSALAVFAAAHGPTLWATAQHLKIEQIRQEDRMFCEQFRMPPGSESFPICVGHLSEVRRLHGERVAAEAAGVF